MAIIHGTQGNAREDLGGTNLIGTGGSDTIYGDGGSDWLEERGGADALYGSIGNNTIKGGGGNDLVSSSGLGWHDGGTGVDVLDLSGISTEGAFDLSLGTGRFNAETPSGPGAITMRNFESIYTGSTSDMVWGNNELRAGGGVDTVYGRDGNDRLHGENGIDCLDGGKGDHLHWGGEGWDTLYGGENDDQLNGGNGEDERYGGNGSDYLTGGYGSDVIDGLSGYDTMSFMGITSGVTVDARTGLAYATNNGMSEIDEFYRIEKVVGSLSADAIYLTDTMAADASTGNDLIVSGSGANAITGNYGNDTASYALSTAGVNVNLATGSESGGWAAGDTPQGIENLVGSSYADTLRTATSGSTLDGGAGNDKLYGSSGADRLIGSGGGDELTGGAGADRFVFKYQSDSPWQSNDHDVIKDFQEGVDKIDLSGLDANTQADGNQAFGSVIHSPWPYQDSQFEAGTIALTDTASGTLVSLNLRNWEEGSPQNPYDEIEMSFLVEGSHTLDASDFIL